MASLKVAESHMSTLLDDPPVADNKFKSMMYMLRECCISTALTWNPIIYLNLINELWRSASVKTGDNGLVKIEASIRGRNIVISEQFISDILKIEHQDAYLTDIDLRVVDEYLEKLGY
ncbi:unnamed protein product [Lactuca saligna]|uniref:Uncharacterized protein n=1 Tax=Lactuca saligna TaxID=75948 RepID=A0AA36A429_LACSI|nr:unnamed protein product [Lactuca saligna]